MFFVMHQIHGTPQWYAVRTARTREDAERQARNYALDNGGSTKVVEARKTGD